MKTNGNWDQTFRGCAARPGPLLQAKTNLAVIVVSSLGSQLQLTIGLVKQLLGFGGVTVHVPFIGALRVRDAVKSLIA